MGASLENGFLVYCMPSFYCSWLNNTKLLVPDLYCIKTEHCHGFGSAALWLSCKCCGCHVSMCNELKKRWVYANCSRTLKISTALNFQAGWLTSNGINMENLMDQDDDVLIKEECGDLN